MFNPLATISGSYSGKDLLMAMINERITAVSPLKIISCLLKNRC